MKIRFRGMFELIEWGFESLADRFGIQRRHIFFGIFVLFLMTLCTLWYIYEKNWVVVSTRKGIRSEQQMTISLDGEESAVQEMSNDIRNNILDTPMAAAASSSSMAQSAANRNAQRSDPQNAASTSQSASGSTASSAAPSSAGAASSASFAPSASQANASVMAGQARSETSQTMSQAATQPNAQSAFRPQFRTEQPASCGTIFCGRPSLRLRAQCCR